MTSILRALVFGAAIVWFAGPALAQEDESTAPAAPERVKPVRANEPAAESDKEPAKAREAEEPPPAAKEGSGDNAAESPAVTGGTRRTRRTRRRVPAAAKPIPAATEPATIDTIPAAAPAEAVAAPPPAPVEHVEHVAPAEHTAPPAPHAEHAAGPATQHGAEHGADHGDHASFSVGTFILQLINFGVLLFLLIYFGGRAMNKALRARHEQLKGDIDEAARVRDDAKLRFDAQEKRVASLEKEVATLRESMRQDAVREQTRMVESAQERARQIADGMRLQIEEQVKAAELALRAEVASVSVKLAAELVRKAVNTDDERRFAREFVAGFDAPADSSGGAR